MWFHLYIMLHCTTAKLKIQLYFNKYWFPVHYTGITCEKRLSAECIFRILCDPRYLAIATLKKKKKKKSIA